MSRACLIVCLLVSGAAPSCACEGETRLMFDRAATLEGILKSGKGEHDAQGPFAYVYLELDRPACVDAPPAAAGDEDAAESIGEAVTRVQIAGEASNQQLPIGKRVSVEGTLFPAHTMWHAEPVLIDAAAVAPQ
jgi:hypothetical protein